MPIFIKLTNGQRPYAQICYSEFRPNRTFLSQNALSTTPIFTELPIAQQIWSGLRASERKGLDPIIYSMNKFLWTSPGFNVIKIGRRRR